MENILKEINFLANSKGTDAFVRNRLSDLYRAARAQLAENERLRAAIAPFITAANDADGYPDDHPVGCDPQMHLEGLTVGDLRRARDAHGT